VLRQGKPILYHLQRQVVGRERNGSFGLREADSCFPIQMVRVLASADAAEHNGLAASGWQQSLMIGEISAEQRALPSGSSAPLARRNQAQIP
jgi:hypothetical protein